MATMHLNTTRLRAIMTECELARAMDIGYPYLNRLLNGQRSPGARAIASFRLAAIAWEEVLEIVKESLRWRIASNEIIVAPRSQ